MGFPLLLIPFAIYNMIAFLTPMDWATKLYAIQLKSGVTWEPTAGDAFIGFSLVMLMFEFIKSTRHGKSLVEHFLSLLLAAGAAAEFVMVNPARIMQTGPVTPAANSVFSVLSNAKLGSAKVAPPRPPVLAPPPHVAPVRAEPVRAEPANPFTRVEPPASPELPGRTEPVVKIEPVQKVGS